MSLLVSVPKIKHFLMILQRIRIIHGSWVKNSINILGKSRQERLEPRKEHHIQAIDLFPILLVSVKTTSETNQFCLIVCEFIPCLSFLELFLCVK